jgi:hypothetical protein
MMFDYKKVQSNHIKTSISSLNPLSVANISRPKSIEEGRANLKRFYGCVDGNLVVLLHNQTRSGESLRIPEGKRVDGLWVNTGRRKNIPAPHPAISSIKRHESYMFAFVDIEKMESLYDLYQITGSGMFNNGAYDPSFTLNLVQNLDSPLVENRPEYFYDLMEFLRDCWERVGGEHLEDAWLSDASRYALFANEDPALKRFGGFYSYSVEEGFSWRWRQMNNTHTRYLHWLLLGPFAPYHFEDSKVSVAA